MYEPVFGEYEKALGMSFFEYQWDFFDWVHGHVSTDVPKIRACLYYKTGAGKSITALVAIASVGYEEVVVITPPSTNDSWLELGEKLGIQVECMSHAKFRMANTKLKRDVPIIADEMHLFGGHGGKGWKKLDRLAKGLQAPLIEASATPNYNDADRVYCIQHSLDPASLKGGYLEFLYSQCVTQQNPFSVTPDVRGFRHFPGETGARDYLNSLPYVFYVEDDVEYTIDDAVIATKNSTEFDLFNVNRRSGRIMASQIEKAHAKVNLALLDDSAIVRDSVKDWLLPRVSRSLPAIVFCNHSTVAEALNTTLQLKTEFGVALITGKTSTKEKLEIIQQFKAGEFDLLIGTASLATGTDGLDKVCDNMVILDDTNDDSLRRQLVGRIMPRGADSDASKKRVSRLLLS